MKKYQIIGQGIAGTLLSMRLFECKVSHRIYNENRHSRSSMIAAGIANPIVLKRLKWVKNAELFTAEAKDFYRQWESILDCQFLHPFKLRHIFKSQGEINHWQEQSAHQPFKQFLGPIILETNNPKISAPLGYGLVNDLFWVDTRTMLNAYFQFAKNHNLVDDNLDEQALKVYCTGHLAKNQQPVLSKAFTPTKGEVMIIRSEELASTEAWHASVFILPIGYGLFKVGASYSHDDINDQPSQEGLSWLKEKLESIYTGPYEVVEHWAGVRPNIKDRQALMGQVGSDYIFNGLGSRGILMGPYLSIAMTDHLLHQKPIPPQWDCQRFI